MLEIKYINRETKEVEKELIAGEYFLNFLHQNKIGIFLLERLVRYRFISYLYGLYMDSFLSKYQINNFVKKLRIDLAEAIIPKGGYQSFNQFFIRELKPESRPINLDSQSFILPSDGRVLVLDKINEDSVFLVKGVRFRLSDFLGDGFNIEPYLNGSIAIIRLAPQDYHRFHFPVDAMVTCSKRLKGYYYSVNPIAINYKPDLFCFNERQLTELKTDLFGTVLMVEVGATMVGKIVQTYQDNQVLKGQEKGYFLFGGSTIVLVFAKKSIEFDAELVANAYNGIETLCKMGTVLGLAKN